MNTPLRRPQIPRRAVLRGGLLGSTFAMAGVLPACSTDPAPDPAGPASPTQPGRATDSSSPREPSGTGAQVLVVYFSRPGENYYYGDRIDLEVGNTDALADVVSARLDELGVEHDVHRLEAADPYPDDYDATVTRNSAEQDADARPALANPLDSIEGYDAVLMGSPIWNVRPPMLMHS